MNILHFREYHLKTKYNSFTSALLLILILEVVFSHSASAYVLPIEVFSPGYNNRTVQVNLDAHQAAQITHLYLRCNRCGYQDKRWDGDPSKIKATVSINGRPQISLKHYTASGSTVGNTNMHILGPEKHYGGIGGGFRTVRMTIPIKGALREGINTLTFNYRDKDTKSIGYRIIELNFLRADVKRIQDIVFHSVLTEGVHYSIDNPARWDLPLKGKHIELGRALWEGRGDCQ